MQTASERINESTYSEQRSKEQSPVASENALDVAAGSWVSGLTSGARPDVVTPRIARALSHTGLSHANTVSRAAIMRSVQQSYGNRAAQVLLGVKPSLQRASACGGTCSCSSCRSKIPEIESRPKIEENQIEDGQLRTQPMVARSELGPGTPLQASVPVNSSGAPLDAGIRGSMESRFGHDFSDVRVHTGAVASDSAAAIDAKAFTFGRDIYFGAGGYNSSTREGMHLLAHELTHTIQQGSASSVARKESLPVSTPSDPEEREAERMADTVMGGGEAAVGLSPNAAPVQRQPDAGAGSATGTANAAAAAPSALPTTASMRDQPAPGSASPIGPPGIIEQKAPETGADTIKFENVLLSTNPEFVRYQLEQMAAWMVNGMSEVAGFLFRLTLSQVVDEPALAVNDRIHAADAKSGPTGAIMWNPDFSLVVPLVPRWLENETRHRVANKERTQRVIAVAYREYRVLSAEAKEFLADFEKVANDKMFEALRESQTRVESESKRYGISPAELYTRGRELHTTFAPAPRSPVDVMRENQLKEVDAVRWRAAEGSRRELIQAATDIQQQAAILQKRKEWVDGIEAQWRSARDPAGPYAFPRARSPLDTTNEFRFRDQLEQARQQFQEHKRAFDEFVQKKQSKFPILAAFAHEGGDLKKLIEAKSDDTALKAVILDEVNEKLKNIYDTRENMEAGKITPWTIPFVVEGTRQRMKIDKGTFRNRVLEDYYAEKKKEKADEDAKWKAISILSLALGLLALIPTPLSPFLAVASSGLGAAVAVHDLQEYMIQSAASGTDFDKARAISQEDPSLFWLAIELVGTVLDLGAAAKSLRAVSGLKRAVVAGEEGAVKLLEAEAGKIGPQAAQRVVQEAEAARAAAVAESRTAGAAAQVIEEEAIQAGKLADAAAERGGHLYQVLKDGSIVRCSKWCAKLELLFGDLFKKHPHLNAELEALRKLKGKQAAEAAGALGERMEYIRQAEQMTLEELEKVLDNPAFAKGTAAGDDLRYIRYQKEGGLLDFEDWFSRSRGGRLGGPEHQAIVEDILKKYPTSTTEVASGERFADAFTPAQPGKKAVYHQVGGTNLRGDPIARERRAISDLRATPAGKDADIIFYPKDKSTPLVNPDKDPRWAATWNID